jgi:long-chain acyl-CoA synthetase
VTTLYTAFAAVADARPEHPAVVDPAGTRSYGWLLRAVDGVALALDVAGVQPGDRVGLLSPNQAEFAAGLFGTARIGASVVPLNPALAEGELAAVLRDAETSVVLAVGAWRERCARALAAAGAASAALIALDDEAEERPRPPRPPVDDGDAAFLVLYSSGSTGRPKRVERSHRKLLWEIERLAAALGLSGDDRLLGAAPFCHVNGLMRSMVLALLGGATLVPAAQFERRAVGRLIESHAISGFIGVPFMFATLAETRWPKPVDFSSLRYCLSSSAPLRLPASRRFRERYGVPVRQLYGTTETGTIALDAGPALDALESVGRPLPGIDVRVLDDAGATLGPGEPGQVAIRSPAAATEYAGRPAESATAFRDGFFRPGDVGRFDGEGRLSLIGRTSLFINRGGFKVNPLEIEEVLEGHPKVREVAVIGEETDLGDERIRAVIVAREPISAEEIVAFCAERLAEFKTPSVVEFRDQLPRSAAGKILRRAL